jgi:hypothetical protein
MGEMQDAWRYYGRADEDAHRRRPIKHEHGGTTVLTEGIETIQRANALAREFHRVRVYIHVECRGRGVSGGGTSLAVRAQ